MNEQNYRFETLQLHAGQEHPDPLSGARAVPIYATTSYVFDDCAQAADRFALKEGGNIYGRLDNPTQEAFERRMAALEGGSSALALASGAAAVTYVLQALAQGHGHIVAQKTIYGGSYNLMAHTLPALGIETTFVNILPFSRKRAFSMRKHWATPAAISQIWTGWQKSLTVMASRWSWTTPLPRPTCSAPLRMARISSSIRLRNSSAAMALRWAA